MIRAAPPIFNQTLQKNFKSPLNFSSIRARKKAVKINCAIFLAGHISAQISRTRLTPDMGFVLENSKYYKPSIRALTRKLKLMTFSRNFKIRLVFTKRPHRCWRQFFLLQPVEHWKMPS